MRHVCGIDAGGTKTVGLLADQTGRILGHARGGGANLQIHGELEVEKVLHQVIEELTRGLHIDGLCLGIAGVDRSHDEDVVRGILRRLGHRERARVANDAVIALVAGSPERTGIVVLAGTGSIAYGIDPRGLTARAGGLGSLLSDEGSGYWLGQHALRAVVRAADGRGPATRLQELVGEALGIRAVGDLVPLIYEQGLPRQRIAALAGLVQEARDAGDEVAAGLTGRAARELAASARAVAHRLDFGGQAFRVVLAGGAFQACPCLETLILPHLDLPDARVEPLRDEPAHGAVRLALDLLG